jgi:hypothetical protein
MNIHGTPLALETVGLADMTERFWYWQGQSGRKYIHSVYELDNCPPLPNAVYVAVKRSGSLRIAVAVGRFQPFWDQTLAEDDLTKLERLGVDEVHVHLLAKSHDLAETVRSDLAAAMGTSYDFSEPTQNWQHSFSLAS